MEVAGVSAMLGKSKDEKKKPEKPRLGASRLDTAAKAPSSLPSAEAEGDLEGAADAWGFDDDELELDD